MIVAIVLFILVALEPILLWQYNRNETRLSTSSTIVENAITQSTVVGSPETAHFHIRVERAILYYTAPGQNPPAQRKYMFEIRFVPGSKEKINWSFVRIPKPTEYRAYIIESPSYCNRNSSTHRTHRVPDGNEYYVSWCSSVKDFDSMVAIAKTWADRTQRYIETGKDISN